MQLDLSSPLGGMGPGGDEGPSWHSAVQPPLPHLRGRRRRGRGAGLHRCPPARTAGQTRTRSHTSTVQEVLTPPRVDLPEAACVASQGVGVRIMVRLQALEGGAGRGGGALQGIVAGRANERAGRGQPVSCDGSGGADPPALGVGWGFSEGNCLDTKRQTEL